MAWTDCWQALGLELPAEASSVAPLQVVSPVDERILVRLDPSTPEGVDAAIEAASQAFRAFCRVPAPARGEWVRRFGQELRRHQQSLAELVTWECGKIASEAMGEVQEMIDICDFAVGLSRQLHGLTMATERSSHRMMEQWHPLGPVAVLSAFNFPVAVWAWNAALALVCGNPVIWKPSPQTPLCALACRGLLLRAFDPAWRLQWGISAEDVTPVLQGDSGVGAQVVDDRRVALVSATGSTAMGRAVGQRVAKRLARSLLELGGNNALIVAPSANLELSLRAIVFSAVGTAGQRCTSLRRLIVHESICESLMSRLERAYESLMVGDPFLAATHVGPLISRESLTKMMAALQRAQHEGGTLKWGGRALQIGSGGAYVTPAVVQMPAQTEAMHEETFAPLLYVLTYRELEEAIALQNAVPQGLSSAIFTDNLREAEQFLGPTGSDCGIANVNIGTSGAEIGGAFGGEKDTGGGRESGSDAWKNYMRRATNTINYGSDMPLAQGIRFDF